MASSTEEASRWYPWEDESGHVFIGMAQPYTDPMILYVSVPKNTLPLLETVAGIPVEATGTLHSLFSLPSHHLSNLFCSIQWHVCPGQAQDREISETLGVSTYWPFKTVRPSHVH